MLEGTDLMSAYAPLSASMAPEDQEVKSVMIEKPSPVVERPTPPPPPPSKSLYDAQHFNKQIEQEQKFMTILQELKRRKEDVAMVNPNGDSLSYFDKLSNKKRDLARLIQFALIIVLGLSIHYMINHYMSAYIANNDMSPERQFFLRLLYPVAIIFILWNLKVFVK